MKHILFVFSALLTAAPAYAADSLFFLEAQGVAGYSSRDNRAIYHSGHANDAMQKNGVGFDYIKKFSSEYGDVGTGALQMRLVWNDSEDKAQVQIYNAYLKGKTSLADVWIGHNRIPFGLASFWDTHADLLQPLSMDGFGFDRDWGAGISHDFADGDFALAFTTGSGMEIETKDAGLLTARASYGVLARDNYNIGVSAMAGKMRNEMMPDMEPQDTTLGGLDFSYNHGRLEHKAEFDFGRKNHERALAAFYRLSLGVLEENRLKLEGQYTYTEQEGISENTLGAGAAYRLDSDWTLRTMYQWNKETGDNRVLMQIYYYGSVK
jgi:hypothetical protein